MPREKKTSLQGIWGKEGRGKKTYHLEKPKTESPRRVVKKKRGAKKSFIR